MLEGDIQSLVQAIFASASSLSVVMVSLGWIPMGIVIDQFLAKYCLVSGSDGTEDRLTRLGRDLPLVPNQLIKSLYAQGYVRVRQIAQTEPASLSPIVADCLTHEIDVDAATSEVALQISSQLVLMAAISVKCRQSWKRKQEKLRLLGNAASDELFALALKNKLTQLLVSGSSILDASPKKLLRKSESIPPSPKPRNPMSTSMKDSGTADLTQSDPQSSIHNNRAEEQIVLSPRQTDSTKLIESGNKIRPHGARLSHSSAEVSASGGTNKGRNPMVSSAYALSPPVSAENVSPPDTCGGLDDGLSSGLQSPNLPSPVGDMTRRDSERQVANSVPEPTWADDLGMLSQPNIKSQRSSLNPRSYRSKSGGKLISRRSSIQSGAASLLSLKSDMSEFRRAFGLPQIVIQSQPNDLLRSEWGDEIKNVIYLSRGETKKERAAFKGEMAELFKTVAKRWSLIQNQWRLTINHCNRVHASVTMTQETDESDKQALQDECGEPAFKASARLQFEDSENFPVELDKEEHVELLTTLLESQNVLVVDVSPSHLSIFFPLLETAKIYGLPREPDTAMVHSLFAVRLRLWASVCSNILVYYGDHRKLIEFHRAGFLDISRSNCQAVSISTLIWVLNSERFHEHGLHVIGTLAHAIFEDRLALEYSSESTMIVYPKSCSEAPVLILWQVWILFHVLVKMLEICGIWRPSLYIEAPYVRVLADMQETGLPCSAGFRESGGIESLPSIQAQTITHLKLLAFYELRRLQVDSVEDLILLICFIKLQLHLLKVSSLVASDTWIILIASGSRSKPPLVL
eukprot:Gregarina_sp_Poly_1__9933@NODE_653_length_6929_cov_33_988487_g496_i0_p1_GENE_NODE_653_length_6929_cov_33_988487_g496_i0NODE_653_length_6929_cov_33_988487_g496_i0_p1_ORF_typecomplete_len802_score107_25_NODE_653_length_6929_cov_33_988487_g496_i023864791